MKKNLTIELIRESAFYKTRPKKIQELIEKVPPTHEYQITETGHVCSIYSYAEDGTLTVVREVNEMDKLTGKIADNITHINVFGLKPEDLTKLDNKPIEVEEDDIKKEEMRIIKIQRSLASNKAEQSMLIYDEFREFEYEGPLTGDVARLMGDKPKIYAEAMLVPDKDEDGNETGTFKFSVAHLTEDQEW